MPTNTLHNTQNHFLTATPFIREATVLHINESLKEYFSNTNMDDIYDALYQLQLCFTSKNREHELKAGLSLRNSLNKRQQDLLENPMEYQGLLQLIYDALAMLAPLYQQNPSRIQNIKKESPSNPKYLSRTMQLFIEKRFCKEEETRQLDIRIQDCLRTSLEKREAVKVNKEIHQFLKHHGFSFVAIHQYVKTLTTFHNLFENLDSEWIRKKIDLNFFDIKDLLRPQEALRKEIMHAYQVNIHRTIQNELIKTCLKIQQKWTASKKISSIEALWDQHWVEMIYSIVQKYQGSLDKRELEDRIYAAMDSNKQKIQGAMYYLIEKLKQSSSRRQQNQGKGCPTLQDAMDIFDSEKFLKIVQFIAHHTLAFTESWEDDTAKDLESFFDDHTNKKFLQEHGKCAADIALDVNIDDAWVLIADKLSPFGNALIIDGVCTFEMLFALSPDQYKALKKMNEHFQDLIEASSSDSTMTSVFKAIDHKTLKNLKCFIKDIDHKTLTRFLGSIPSDDRAIVEVLSQYDIFDILLIASKHPRSWKSVMRKELTLTEMLFKLSSPHENHHYSSWQQASKGVARPSDHHTRVLYYKPISQAPLQPTNTYRHYLSRR
jgi:hypothetical protein